MLLGVNIDHVATLRNARGGANPDPIMAAKICEDSGATSITAHLREDRRHIKDADIKALSRMIKTNLNMEMAVTDEMQKIALEIKPHSVCLVPEKRQEITTEGGLDVAGRIAQITTFVKPLKDAGIMVSLFIDPTEDQVYAAAKTGAQFVELHTGQYSLAFGTHNETEELTKIQDMVELGTSLGLKVNAGHGLDYQNVKNIVKIPNLYELNIGHSIVSRAVFVGLSDAVKEMAKLVR